MTRAGRLRRTRRPLLLALLVGGVLTFVLLGRGGGDGGRSDYRVDAIFAAARGIGPRQVVKIAGARVGTVVDVRLTRENKARVQMRIDPRFAPFRADARCAIRPEGLISENFVSCAPGTPARPALAATGDAAPTVPVSRTSAPVSLQDLFAVWTVPTTDRLRVLLNELGAGLAGRGSDLQAVLRRAAPALTSARRAIALVTRQRGQLERIVAQAEPVITRLAARDRDVQRFISTTARLSTTTARHRDDLRVAIARMPALLRSAEPALRQLDATGVAVRPVLRNLRVAAPNVERLTADVPPLTTEAVRALAAARRPLTLARGALRPAAPVLERLQRFAVDADPAGRDLDRLLVDLRDDGVLESLQRGAYAGAGLTNHYDPTSHVLLGNLSLNQCVLFATSPVPGCDAHLDGRAVPKARGAASRAGGSSETSGVAPSVTRLRALLDRALR